MKKIKVTKKPSLQVTRKKLIQPSNNIITLTDAEYEGIKHLENVELIKEPTNKKTVKVKKEEPSKQTKEPDAESV